MKKRKFQLSNNLIIMVCLISSLIFISTASGETFNFKVSTLHPPNSLPVTDSFNVFDKELTERTNGRVKLTWYHAQSLVKIFEAYRALKAGVVDMAFVPVAFMPKQFPISYGLGLPFVADNSTHALDVGAEMLSDIPEIQKEWSEVKNFFLFASDINNFHLSEKRVQTFEDLNGLRIGSPFPSTLKMLKLLPCSGVRLLPQDIYVGVQRKTVDGVLTADASLHAWKVTELVKYHTIGRFGVMPMAFCMSKKSYEKLPPDIKEIFDELVPSMMRLGGVLSTFEGSRILDALKKRGDVFDVLPPEELTKFKNALAPLNQEWIGMLNARGMDGKAIFNKLLAIADDSRKNPYGYDEWWKKSPSWEKIK